MAAGTDEKREPIANADGFRIKNLRDRFKNKLNVIVLRPDDLSRWGLSQR
jgi:hypothetical protein